MLKEDNPLVTENMGLVHLCARRFVGRGIDYEDMVQAGSLGLVKAARNFDPGRGLRFSTYAVPVILGEIRRLFRDGGAMRVSRGLRELAQQAQRISEGLEAGLGRAPTVGEIADKLGVTPQRAALALGALRRPMSLTGGEEGEQLEIPVEASEEQTAERLTLYAIIERMEVKDRELIRCRYFKGMTQAKTAEELGMTQVQVSRREKKLLAYMRQEFGDG
ncbi:sigma-70 family RNA polymerase sigma factor [Acutalibacter muris]|uniref:Flagellar biosynthesis protein FliA n=1 Tax=Acutalibacter muris TaxID=1796620 RepID=A0A1Z2XQL3_9FIRM|nr:sigma-70 family RNA polymerase sigma factor [Acutalibacter muris]ANU52600.1 flagellar biosynthesis protein FliA [Hungateiclostridiaceae bacterium KB18]ASB40733.1 flagellar biosynthesis protein FliA [Acutalibacter muris]QQR30013.1 sigma-70 family RNA polymerase sigma factor [Acutalibacter muris]